MSRLSFLAAPALALALTVPASAQESTPDTVAVPADSVVADSVMADSVAAEPVVAPDPDRAREFYEEGRAALTAQNYDEALAQFDQALLYNDAYAVAALGRGQALAQLGRLEDSRSALESAVEMAEASDAANADDVVRTTQRYLDQINGAIESRAANAAQQQQEQAAQAAASEAEATNQKVEEAIAILQANEVTEAQAIDAYALLEQARLAGYDTDQIAFYYAKALNTMNRGADAIPYAETALAQSEGQDDRSLYYIQLGIANMEAGNVDEARAAFEAIDEGQSWHSWAQHYLRELDQS
ncbi:hypothetical protein RQM47_07655 [Rubrivirga sp. S365]|uniref:Tetratricopeptide repeat-containing protein n=1 Tax=Rubrivirga litoralis TaxID=3075598 RepID=A0ABU3BR84_9BACT|nr:MULTISPECIES: tetratricopeptide repeat protein [unclassified Rubrivirga]MDT0631798.1 hypothetical protein [Rubrivirga sp. F394]MDT7856510.1 hypothetical protein [Rubrivirga sp. S365]